MCYHPILFYTYLLLNISFYGQDFADKRTKIMNINGKIDLGEQILKNGIRWYKKIIIP